MTEFLSFNNKSKSDISIFFTDGQKIHLMSSIVIKTFRWFDATESMKRFDDIKAKNLFHDEDVLAEALVRAQFGDRFEIKITPENWIAHLHLCDYLDATEEHWNYILSFLPKLDITKIDQSTFDYMSIHCISRDAALYSLCGRKIDMSPIDKEQHCRACNTTRKFNAFNVCTSCCRGISYNTGTTNIVTILNWVSTQHHHAPLDIVETRTIIRNYRQNANSISSLPVNSQKVSFML